MPNKRKQQQRRKSKAPRAQVDLVVREGQQVARQNVRRSMRARRVALAAMPRPKASGIETLAMAIADPGSVRALRLPTQSMPRTAAFTSDDTYTVGVPSVAAPNGFSAGELVVAFCGQMGRVANIWQTLSTSQYGAVNMWNIFPTNALINSSQWWPVQQVSSANGPHGPTMAAGVANGVSFLLMNATDTLRVNATTIGTVAGAMRFEIYQFSQNSTPVSVSSKSVPLTAGALAETVIFTAPAPGYYAVQFVDVSNTSGALTGPASIAIDLLCNATTGWKQVSMKDLDQDSFIRGDPALGERARLNAASFLVTNTSAELYKQGTVTAGRLRLTDPLLASKDLLVRCISKYTGPAAKGCYTFRENTQMMGDFRSATNDVGGILFDLTELDYVHLMSFTCPGYASSPNTYTLLSNQTIEFETDSSRYDPEVASPMYTNNMLVEARRLINSRPEWFFENPTHMATIYNFIKRGLGQIGAAATKYGPTLARAGMVVAPEAAPALEALAQLLTHLRH